MASLLSYKIAWALEKKYDHDASCTPQGIESTLFGVKVAPMLSRHGGELWRNHQSLNVLPPTPPPERTITGWNPLGAYLVLGFFNSYSTIELSDFWQ